jgi:hypothetical protein
MMARTQVTLDPELQRRARERASQLGISFAEYLRSLVAKDLGRRRATADPSAVFGLGRSDGADVARDKDDMVGAAVAAGRARRRRRR